MPVSVCLHIAGHRRAGLERKGQSRRSTCVLGKGRLSVEGAICTPFEVRSSVSSGCAEMTLPERSEDVGRCEDNVVITWEVKCTDRFRNGLGEAGRGPLSVCSGSDRGALGIRKASWSTLP